MEFTREIGSVRTGASSGDVGKRVARLDWSEKQTKACPCMEKM